MSHSMRQEKEFLIGILSRGCQITDRFDSQIRAVCHRGNATPLSPTCGGLGIIRYSNMRIPSFGITELSSCLMPLVRI